jgi:hypothetical protein
VAAHDATDVIQSSLAIVRQPGVRFEKGAMQHTDLDLRAGPTTPHEWQPWSRGERKRAGAGRDTDFAVCGVTDQGDTCDPSCDCPPTEEATCGETCGGCATEGPTCPITNCNEMTCGGADTCMGTCLPTCQGHTCNEATCATCQGNTCAGNTCEGTCATCQETCNGPTCAGHTCHGTCDTCVTCKDTCSPCETTGNRQTCMC